MIDRGTPVALVSLDSQRGLESARLSRIAVVLSVVFVAMTVVRFGSIANAGCPVSCANEENRVKVVNIPIATQANMDRTFYEVG